MLLTKIMEMWQKCKDILDDFRIIPNHGLGEMSGSESSFYGFKSKQAGQMEENLNSENLFESGYDRYLKTLWKMSMLDTAMPQNNLGSRISCHFGRKIIKITLFCRPWLRNI